MKQRCELGLQRLRYLRFLLFDFLVLPTTEFLQKIAKETKVGVFAPLSLRA